MNKVLLAFDMDDTLCDTQSEVNERLTVILRTLGQNRNLLWTHLNKGKLSTMEYPTNLREIITNGIIIPGHYQDTVKPTSLMCDDLIRMIECLRIHMGRNLTTAICTHRGPTNHSQTYQWIREHNAERAIDVIHAIDPKEHANKIEYLKAEYPGHRILLLDDNPFGNIHKEMDFTPEVLIYNELASYPCHNNQIVFSSLIDLQWRVLNLSLGSNNDKIPTLCLSDNTQ